MKMSDGRIPPVAGGFAAGILTVLVVVAAADVLFGASPVSWASELRNWLAATSGWVGFFAAAVGAYFVFGQLAEQRRQTAFILGDGAATTEVYTYAMDGSRAVFRIINWNRRILTIRRVEITCGTVLVPRPLKISYTMSPGNVEPLGPGERGPIEVEFKPARFDAGKSTYVLQYAIAADGWLNRSASPNFLDISIHFKEEAENFTGLVAALEESVIATVVFHGDHDEAQQDVVLLAPIPVCHFLPYVPEKSRNDRPRI